MNILLLVSAIALSCSSAFDGWTTVRFVKMGDEEGNTAWLLGKTPGPLRVYGLGGLVIAGEIAVAMLANHFSVYAGYAFALAGGYQTYTHIRDGRNNLKLT